MIEFRSVTKRFPGGTVAVDNFSLVLPSRKTTVLVGTSGSGKTTLLRMINRMVDPTSGTVEIDGADIGTLEPVQLRRSIGYVMQNSGLLPTVRSSITSQPFRCFGGYPEKRPGKTLCSCSIPLAWTGHSPTGIPANSLVVSNSAWALPAASLSIPTFC